ncbi:hypothetical protein P153DRAFT_158082 [Dothidotthia symphoricarpi CBS 119687]|uniref:Uncharacterized protein n=1 Tax=Dothidotthia symphoricarpi CBS 119687 TaxID=1392245 RepID=A0A6A6ANM2_9PLEO|nr:uncharacterized protein P153DRAFT_158082 [Dothidotthia symphoricarpi CBS 119687]KAF2133509.1 hypothetical protein P153DRAFT_158082 [Dothidotthia symphoricarpi CBS 119687]
MKLRVAYVWFCSRSLHFCGEVRSTSCRCRAFLFHRSMSRRRLTRFVCRRLTSFNRCPRLSHTSKTLSAYRIALLFDRPPRSPQQTTSHATLAMAMGGTNTSSKRPAVWIGGRRRLSRRSGLPRSNTAPMLGPKAATASLVSSVATDLGSSPRASEESNMRFFSPGKANVKDSSNNQRIIHRAAASPASSPAGISRNSPALASPRHQAPRTPGSPPQYNPFRDSPTTMPVVSSPLPPTTPSKAAQFLGIEVDVFSQGQGSIRRDPFLQDGIFDSRPDVSSRLPKFREEDMECDAPKAKRRWGGSTSKAMRVLGNLPSFGSGIPKRTPHHNFAAAGPLSPDEDLHLGYASDSDLHMRSRQVPPPSRPVSVSPRRRRRKRGPKSLDRMSPITEASFDELRTIYNHEEDDETELEAISEYESDYPPRSASMMPRSHTELFLDLSDTYELEEYDLSPTDDVIEEEPEEEEGYNMHPGTKVDLSYMEWQEPANLQVRSPLQAVEDRLLNATEDIRRKASQAALCKLDAAKLRLNTENSVLKEQHKKMKRGFSSMKLRVMAQEQSDVDFAEEADNEDDMMSIGSSIDLDEEPTVQVAQVSTSTRITPGVVKRVDIPARKSNVLLVDAETSGAVKDVAFVEVNGKESGREDLKPDINDNYPAHYDRTAREKKAKMPRDESQVLVHKWIDAQNPDEQRPLSERIDHDVLADQQIPPAPFPKENCPFPSPPKKRLLIPLPPSKKLPKHTCLNNGHIFHPIDLEHVPDRVVINSLEVRPYLQTNYGVRQHVHVPVFCNRCGEDVEEEMWECEIAVCRMTVCKACAEDMEEEWQERAIGSWAH